MSEKRKHRRWDEYLKYLKGELSERERHEIERDLEADPFLREAMEGFEKITPEEAEEDLPVLHDRLRRRVHRRRRIAIYSAAAAVASLLVIGTIFLNIYDLNPDEKGVTRLEQEIPVRKPPVLSETDGNEEVTAEERSEPGEDFKKSAPRRSAGDPVAPGDVSEPVPDRAAGKAGTAKEPIVAMEAEPTPKPVNKGIAPEDRSMGNAAQEVPEASAVEEIMPDAMAKDKINPEDPAKKQAVRERRVSRIREDRALDNIPEEQMEETLQLQLTAVPDQEYSGILQRQEMLTIRFENDEGATRYYSPSELDRQALQPEFNRVLPEGGYTAFAEFLRNSLDITLTDTASLLRAFELRFTVTGKGRLENIEPLDTTPPEIADKVIRLLKRGPDWYFPKDPGRAAEEIVRIRILY